MRHSQKRNSQEIKVVENAFQRSKVVDNDHCCCNTLLSGVRFNLTSRTASIGNVVVDLMRNFENTADAYWHLDWLGWNWAPPEPS